ncbi:MAG TPA: hypothetical protein VK249_06400 [Anaerolineales bacterium]|nr:hypothetical protein [Anaerolineales bacterium]
MKTGRSLVNDVVVIAKAAHFADSYAPVLYKVSLNPETGELPDPPTFEVIQLSGDDVFVPGSLNTNGIDALPNGNTLTIFNSKLGGLYTMEAATGVNKLIKLGKDNVTSFCRKKPYTW